MNQRSMTTALAFGLLGILVTAHPGGPSQAGAQVKKQSWEVILRHAGAKTKTDPPIVLRPNVTQGVQLFVRNTEKFTKKKVRTMLVRVSPQGKEEVVAHGEIEEAAFNLDTPVVLKPAVPAKEEAKPAPAPVRQEGPPFTFQLRIYEGELEPVVLPLAVILQQPRQYVRVSAAPRYERDKSRLSLALRPTVDDDPATPPYEVKLVLNPDVIPGLIAPKLGVFRQELTASNPQKELFGDRLQFLGDFLPENGRIYVTVDGYERAYIFKSAFKQGTFAELDQTRVRIRAPRYYTPVAAVKPDAKGEVKLPPRLHLEIEADGIADANTRIEVGFNRTGDERFETLALLPGLRRQEVLCTIDKEGNPRFQTVVSDWKLDVDVAGVYGKRFLRVRVLGKADDPVALADEHADESVVLYSPNFELNPHAPLTFDALHKAVLAEVLILADDKKPEAVRFVDLPGQVAAGELVRLRATVAARDEAEQSPIAGVHFFAGDPLKDPPVMGRLDKRSRLWEADVRVPADVKDKLSVTVQFTTATNLSDKSTAFIPLTVPKSPGETTRITGVVTSMFDNNKKLKGIEVVLKEKGLKGQVKDKKKTDDKGVFVFDNVAPGDYTVTAARPGVARGVTAISVQKGKTATADIALKRFP